MNEFVLTDRMKVVMERLHRRTEVVTPMFLFHEIYQEGTGICAEVKWLIDGHVNTDWSKHLIDNEREVWRVEGVLIDSPTLAIFEEARSHMQRYGQLQVQEGHVISALLGEPIEFYEKTCKAKVIPL
ncbi:hypothetical protein H0266_04530 [Halobacillus locisalis]|uniref:Uncharacterized protein n=1 Tax=Halobacillus locisalis TaxID=220753 RepID=A0A838CQZ5_9BACI|nr:hypothetical protein [Halobacillus locisalis]MBA2174165.1 hypothetical protein [Halobacillus locisalis]